MKVDSSVRQPTEENEDWTDDEGILYRSMIRSDAEPNEGPIWVQQLSSADGDIVKEAFPRQDQMGGWEVGLDFTKEGGEKFANLTGEIAQMSDSITGAPEGCNRFGQSVGKRPHSQTENRWRKCCNQRKL